jgi:hypothetical protein
MQLRFAKFLGCSFVLLLILLFAFSSHTLLRTNSTAALSPLDTLLGVSGASAAPRQVVRRIRPIPVAPSGRLVILDGVNYPWTDAGFSAALAAAGSNATVLLPANAAVTLTSPHTIADDDVTIRCDPGAAFVSGINQTNLITITGTNDGILDCEFLAGSSPYSNPLFLWKSDNARLQNNVASGFVGDSTSFVYLVGAESSVIRGNQCTVALAGASCIFGEKDAVNTVVEANELDESLGGPADHAITFHSTTAGESVSGTQILNNRILAGQGFCVEIGAFGGEPANGFVISGNTCTMNANGLGGYSVGSAATFWSVANNTFDANGFIPSIACLEVAGASDGILLGNSCNGGPIALSNVDAERVTISSNVIYNFHGAAGIYIGTAVRSGKMSDDLITSNLIHLPPGVASAGIWQQCLAPNAVCDRDSYYYNTIVSDGTPGSVGIKFENDYGTSADETLGPNTFRTPAKSTESLGTITFTSASAASPAPSFLPSQWNRSATGPRNLIEPPASSH